MATWEEVRQRVLAAFRLERDDGDEIVVSVNAPSGRAQRVYVRKTLAWGHEMLEVRSAFGDARRYRAEELLTQTLDLPIGGFARHGDWLLVVDKSTLRHLPADGATFLVEAIGRVADALEHGDGTAPDRF